VNVSRHLLTKSGFTITNWNPIVKKRLSAGVESEIKYFNQKWLHRNINIACLEEIAKLHCESITGGRN
jgi:hypothetical protein